MKETCRICARELCGNQRRWIFHTATKLNLQVLLSHVLGKDVPRDGRGEFACSKCAFMLDRIYRFDTVIARIEALSIERLQKLLLEKDRLKFCIASMYRKNNEEPPTEAKVGNGTVDISSLPDVRYTALLQEDFAYSGFECWAENEDQNHESHSCHASEGPGSRPRRCRGCAALRVADSDYEAICKVPRKVARSISYGPSSTRWSTSICTEEPALSEVGPSDVPSTKVPADGESMEEGTPGSSVESLDATGQASLPQQKDEETERSSKELPKCDCCSDDQANQYTCGHKLELALSMIKGFDYKPIQSPRGSKLPIPVKSSPLGAKPGHLMADGSSPNFLSRPVKPFSKTPVGYSLEISDLQELWDDLCEDYLPLRFQNITEEPFQQQELNSNEATMTQQCVPDSHLAELQDKIEQTEAANKILQEKLNEMSCQLKSAQEASQRQDCTIQNLSQSLKSRESETEELYQVIEGQNDTMTKLRDMLHRSQLGQLQVPEGGSPAQQQIALLDLQNALFCSQLEVQKFQRASRRKERLLEDAKRNLQFMETAAQELEQQKEAAWTHNQELRSTLQQVQEDLRNKNKQLHMLEGTKCRENQAREQSFQRLNYSLQQKDQLLQEYRELMQYQNNSEKSLEANEVMLEKLRNRIQDRDIALERAIDEKFCALEEKEKELHQLHLAVRERDHDLERLRYVLSSNEATIQSMESLLQAKSLELEQLSVTCQNLQWLEEEMKKKFSHWQKEQEGIIQQLQTSLHDRNKEVEDLSATLLCKLGPGQSEVAEELCLRLQRKERMLQDLLSDRNKQALEHEMEIQDLLQSMNNREKDSQVALGKMVQALMERSTEVQTLRQHIRGKNLGFSTNHPAEATTFISQHHEEQPVQESMQENVKDELTTVTAKGDSSTSRPWSGNMEAAAELEKELIHTKEELELITRKERESRMELSALQSMVAVQAEELQVQAADMESLTRNMQIKEDLIKDLQMQLVDPEDIPAVQHLTQEVLLLREKVASAESPGQETENRKHQLLQMMEGLVEERGRLNEALQAERRLYSSLVEFHTHPGGSERDQALQVELEGAQVLHSRLEEALGRSLERLSRLETMAAFGGTAVGEDTEDASTEFTDSIEEEAAHNNTHQQFIKEASEKNLRTEETQHFNRPPPLPIRGEKNSGLEEEVLCLKAEIHQHLEQKKKAEGELKDLKAQIEEAGFSSVSHIRNTLLSLCLENAELKEQMGEAMSEAWEMEEDKEKEEGLGEEARRRLKEDSLCAEIRKLHGKLRNANTIINLLKEQLTPNRKEGDTKFNPQFIVRLAKEIDRLKTEVIWAPGKPLALGDRLQEDQGSKRPHSRPQTLDLVSVLDLPPKDGYQGDSQGSVSSNGPLPESSLQGPTHQLRSQLEQCRQRYQDLQEKLLVSEATVQVQASQLEQYRVLFREPGVKQDSKQVQVDLQDLGYETCGRSENEAEREETTSPEFEEQDVFSDPRVTESLPSQYNFLGSALTSSPLKKPLGKQKDFLDYGKSEDIAVLQQHIRDLKARLQNSDKVIQNLKCRVRSFSITSDYASSLERPRKMKLKGGDLTSSPSHSLTDEDEGWQSDSMGVFCPPEMQARKDLEKLVQRVTLLEAQLPKSQMEGKLTEELKSATWPGKYDSLIQAQARELSHLRQKVREGRGVCHILSQHFRDTIKAFEDLLRGTDIDYYLGQSFREQLAQGSQLTERLASKLNTKDRGKMDDQSSHELLALRLSKELQEKDKVIEVLQSKLNARSLSPSSSHALSDSHRSPSSTSFLSDEMEASSDMDVASEYTQYEERCTDKASDSIHHSSNNAAPSSNPSCAAVSQGAKKDSSSIPATVPSSQKSPKEASQTPAGLYFNSIPKPIGICQPPFSSIPSISLPFGLPPPAAPPLLGCCGTSVLSLAEAQQELQMLQKQLGESIAPTTPSMPAPLPGNLAEVGPSPHCLHPPHRTSQSHPLGISAELCRSADSSLLSNSGLWETVKPQKGSTLGELPSNSAVCQPQPKLTGADLLEEHLSEIRNLRQRLEESICINDRLREQLEHRLSSATRANGSSSSIYMLGLESMPQLCNENRILREENQSLQAQLNQLSKEHAKELEHLREALLASRTRLQELEAELERQKVERRQTAEDLKQKQQEILQFREERLSLQEKNNRLQNKVLLLQEQCDENQRLFQSLRSELQVYETYFGNSKQGLKAYSWDICPPKPLSNDLSTLVSEVRALRSQLEYSIQVNNSLRQQLQQQLNVSPQKVTLNSSCVSQDLSVTNPEDKWQFFQDSISSPPVRDVGMNIPTSIFSTATSKALDPQTSPFQRTKEVALDISPVRKNPPMLEGDAPDGSFSNKHGRHVIGHIDDYSALKQQILEGKVLVHKMVSLMQVTLNSPVLEAKGTEVLASGSIYQLRGSTNTLHQILEESASLLTMFWRAALPNAQSPIQQKKKEESMKGEILELKTKLLEKENLLQSTNERLKTANKMKESMEHLIINQLTRTHDVLKKARTNLEKNTSKINYIKHHPSPSKD
ncbi:putative neuroblastoma breakpoint family member 7 isoform X2 [Sarcophilus harrisii]|uniref:putative neuroblastoma breakpoint family member 7 isoform X2 n=1 Tax=Sarcophilus harrisii TaxID=9305 RepID=UPI001301C5B3|nr:putative neuroblastoma breakpoint family member 7 isoform X2 [Sarcophilus harrisii]